MAAAPTLPRTTLRVQRRFAASRERVFDAWTRPELFVRWFTPYSGSSSDAEIDLRVGGAWRVRMKPRLWPAGKAFGTYLEVEPPERLVYTLAWENMPLGPETLVTVEFNESDGETEVVLVQERLGTRRGRRGHALGWRLSLERLGQLVESGRDSSS
jgi:uncharacterized protein YndB with AHSA1/START domain